jgi:hypothetical protein
VVVHACVGEAGYWRRVVGNNVADLWMMIGRR